MVQMYRMGQKRRSLHNHITAPSDQLWVKIRKWSTYLETCETSFLMFGNMRACVSSNIVKLCNLRSLTSMVVDPGSRLYRMGQKRRSWSDVKNGSKTQVMVRCEEWVKNAGHFITILLHPHTNFGWKSGNGELIAKDAKHCFSCSGTCLHVFHRT